MGRKRKPQISIPGRDARVGADGSVTYIGPDRSSAGMGAGRISTLPSPIDESLSRGHLTDEQHAAAVAYIEAHRQSIASRVQSIRVHSVRARSAGASGFDPRAAAAVEFDRLGRVLLDELSAIHRAILDRFLLDEVPANRAAAEQRLKPRQGIGIVRQALDCLAAAAKTENARARDQRERNA